MEQANKIITVVRGGLVESIFANNQTQVVLIDWDNINAGDFPDCTPKEPDFIFKDGEAHEIFLPTEKTQEKNIVEQLQQIKF